MKRDIAVIIVAAGRGERAGPGGPKQYRKIRGKPLLRHSLERFVAHPEIGQVLTVIAASDEERFAECAGGLAGTTTPVVGGETRQQSVHLGLKALASTLPEIVLIHDAARPFVSTKLIDSVIMAVRERGAAIPALPVTDTLKHSRDGRTITATPDRTEFHAAQTPQGFRFADILEAHDKAAANGRAFTDDAAIMEWLDKPVALVAGEPENHKVTLPQDFIALDVQSRETRVGTGYDIHRFGPGDSVTLCGIQMPHDASLIGHSDADAGLHVLTDAILGALAEGDIGTHFPPSDPKWRGEPSDTFLKFAIGRLAARGGRILHLDLTMMCEAPKIVPHATAMRASVATICGIAESRVSVKATTSEKMGFVGRGEGLVAMATATIELPGGD